MSSPPLAALCRPYSADSQRAQVAEVGVADAARAGQFKIHAVDNIDQGIEILTGLPAGTRGDDGRYPKGSINARVEMRIRDFAEARRSFGLRLAKGAHI